MTAKVLLNSVISTPNARFLGLDIKNMYLHSGLPTPEYMRIPQALTPQEIIDQYQLQEYFHNGYLYCEIQKGLYGLPQAGKLAHDKLKKFTLVQLHQAEYDLHEDWDGELYISMTLKWDYSARTVELSMPGYIDEALKRFAHPDPLHLNIPHSDGHALPMANPSNLLQMMIELHFSIQAIPKESNKLRVPYFTTPEPLIIQCSWHSMILQLINLHPPN